MKWIIAFLCLLLIGCQTTDMPDDLNNDSKHIGCAPKETVNNSCTLAEENNADLFDTLNENMTVTKIVNYGPANGFLALPAKEGLYPAVIMIHEWWGLNDNIKTMAKLLAQEGYVVLAVDLYNGSVATDSQQAGMLAGKARQNPNLTVENMRMAATYLRSLENVEKEKIASMGWCFGGGQSLMLATSGEPLKATVIYYGTLTDDTQTLSRISWPVLGIFGEQDTSIPVSSVNLFDNALHQLNITHEIHIYPGVGHAFANPSGARYAKDETKDAWQKTVNFLDKSLKE